MRRIRKTLATVKAARAGMAAWRSVIGDSIEARECSIGYSAPLPLALFCTRQANAAEITPYLVKKKLLSYVHYTQARHSLHYLLAIRISPLLISRLTYTHQQYYHRIITPRIS